MDQTDQTDQTNLKVVATPVVSLRDTRVFFVGADSLDDLTAVIERVSKSWQKTYEKAYVSHISHSMAFNALTGKMEYSASVIIDLADWKSVSEVEKIAY